MKRRVKQKKNGYALLYDIIIIALGIGATFVLSSVGAIDALVHSLRDYSALSSFVTGIFFTSTFTIAPASVALVHIAETTPLNVVATWGALGAMCGDLILFYFIRDRFSEDLKAALGAGRVKHLLHSFHLGFMKWLSPILGAILIASPLPDELGISLMGISKVRVSLLMPIAYVMNYAGMYLIVGFANAFS